MGKDLRPVVRYGIGSSIVIDKGIFIMDGTSIIGISFYYRFLVFLPVSRLPLYGSFHRGIKIRETSGFGV